MDWTPLPAIATGGIWYLLNVFSERGSKNSLFPIISGLGVAPACMPGLLSLTCIGPPAGHSSCVAL
eukprot:scaffold585_cov330-Pavlova_lutheri.AAC.17